MHCLWFDQRFIWQPAIRDRDSEGDRDGKSDGQRNAERVRTRPIRRDDERAMYEGAAAHFYTEKIGNRWWICDPAGNGFFLKGVYDIVANNNNDQTSFIQAKYAAGPLQTGKPIGPSSKSIACKHGDSTRSRIIASLNSLQPPLIPRGEPAIIRSR